MYSFRGREFQLGFARYEKGRLLHASNLTCLLFVFYVYIVCWIGLRPSIFVALLSVVSFLLNLSLFGLWDLLCLR